MPTISSILAIDFAHFGTMTPKKYKSTGMSVAVQFPLQTLTSSHLMAPAFVVVHFTIVAYDNSYRLANYWLPLFYLPWLFFMMISINCQRCDLIEIC